MEESLIDMTALIGRIDRLLMEKKLSAARMARELGFSTGLYSQWKKGTQTPSAAKLLAVAQYLGVSVDYLLGYEPNESAVPLRRAIIAEIQELDEKSLEKVLDYVRFTSERQKKEQEGKLTGFPPSAL